jgi:hypothetical protein
MRSERSTEQVALPHLQPAARTEATMPEVHRQASSEANQGAQVKTCKRCKKSIQLKPSGQHFKWFAGKEWRCPEPGKPVQGHEPEVAQ